MAVLFFPGADLPARLVAILVWHLNIALRLGVRECSARKVEQMKKKNITYYYYRVVERVMRED